MTHPIGLDFHEKDIELLGFIKSGVVCDETKQHNDVTDLPCIVYTKNKIELS